MLLEVCQLQLGRINNMSPLVNSSVQISIYNCQHRSAFEWVSNLSEWLCSVKTALYDDGHLMSKRLCLFVVLSRSIY